MELFIIFIYFSSELRANCVQPFFSVHRCSIQFFPLCYLVPEFPFIMLCLVPLQAESYLMKHETFLEFSFRLQTSYSGVDQWKKKNIDADNLIIISIQTMDYIYIHVTSIHTYHASIVEVAVSIEATYILLQNFNINQADMLIIIPAQKCMKCRASIFVVDAQYWTNWNPKKVKIIWDWIEVLHFQRCSRYVYLLSKKMCTIIKLRDKWYKNHRADDISLI